MPHKAIRNALVFVIILTLTIGSFPAAFAVPASITDTETTVPTEQLYPPLRSLCDTTTAEYLRDEIGVDLTKPITEADIDQIGKSIEKKSEELEDRIEVFNSLESQLASRSAEIEILEPQVHAIMLETRRLQKQFDDAMENSYKNQDRNMDFLRGILNASSIPEALLVADTWQRVMTKDKETIDSLVVKREELEQKKLALLLTKQSLLATQQQVWVERQQLERETLLLDSVYVALDGIFAEDLDGSTQQEYFAELQSFITSAPISEERKQVVFKALDQLGKPYHWAYEGPDEFDCSGLMYYSYGNIGKSIPRVANDQMHNAPYHLQAWQLQPGDLIFTGSGDHASHVIMYAGLGYTVESPRTGDVVKIRKLSGRPRIIGYGSYFSDVSQFPSIESSSTVN